MILKKGNTILNTVCDEVELNSDVSELIETMFMQMIQHKGIGLAANQIGVTKRVITMQTQNYTGAIINPVITNKTDTMKMSSEGCLSVPNAQVKVKRNYKVTVEGFNENWEPIKVNMKQLSAYCVQHEIDHLNGITI